MLPLCRYRNHPPKGYTARHCIYFVSNNIEKYILNNENERTNLTSWSTKFSTLVSSDRKNNGVCKDNGVCTDNFLIVFVSECDIGAKVHLAISVILQQFVICAPARGQEFIERRRDSSYLNSIKFIIHNKYRFDMHMHPYIIDHCEELNCELVKRFFIYQ